MMSMRMAAAGLLPPPHVHNARADGGLSLKTAVINWLWWIIVPGVLQRWRPDVGSDLADWIWSTTQGSRAVVGRRSPPPLPPSLS
jgi:hypothetical protein